MPQTKEADLLVQNKALYEDKEQLSQVNNGAFYISQPKVTHSARFFPSCLTRILGFCISSDPITVSSTFTSGLKD